MQATAALVAEVVHGAPSRFNDPARFSFAHGGKDGHPHPVPLKTYDESVNFLRSSLDAAKVGHTEKLDGFGEYVGVANHDLGVGYMASVGGGMTYAIGANAQLDAVMYAGLSEDADDITARVGVSFRM